MNAVLDMMTARLTIPKGMDQETVQDPRARPETTSKRKKDKELQPLGSRVGAGIIGPGPVACCPRPRRRRWCTRRRCDRRSCSISRSSCSARSSFSCVRPTCSRAPLYVLSPPRPFLTERNGQACRAFHALVQDAPELQYTLELHASDQADNPLCTLPARARLAELHRRRRAWRALAFAAPRTAALPGACTAYELVGGVFAQMGDAHALAARWLYDGGALERGALDVPARDLALDPSVDLIALVELPCVCLCSICSGADGVHRPGNPPTVHVHLRTLSANTRHPAARFGRLTHRTGGRVDSAVVQLHGTSLAFFWAAYDAPGLVIWNWQTGYVGCVGRWLN
jgi:hypothetical protein